MIALQWLGEDLDRNRIVGLIVLCVIGIASVLRRSAAEDKREREERRRKNRIANGQCVHCGYALQGNTSGVCPECGTPLTPPSPAAPLRRSE